MWDGPMPDRGRETVIIIWILVAFATIFTALRFYAKIWRLGKLWWDDWVLLASWLFFLFHGIWSQRAVDYGLGKYPCDIDPLNFAGMGLEGENLGSTFGMFAVVWSKTAFAITLLRLTDGKTKAFIWFVIISMNVIMTVEVILVWVKCTPVQRTWDKSVPGTCWEPLPVNIYGAFVGCYSGVCDILLALLPWKLVWGLRMQKKEKFGVAIAMSLGVLAGVTAFVKSEKIFILGQDNFSYYGSELLVWAGAEIGTTIMAACIPVLRVFFREVKSLSTARSKSDYPPEFSGGSNDTKGSSVKSPHLGNTAAKMPRPKTIGSQPIKLAHSKSLSDDLDSPTCVDGRDDNSEKYILDSQMSSESSRQQILRTQEYEVEYHDTVRRSQQSENRSRNGSFAGRRAQAEHELSTIPRTRFV
ncbi:hypothetical protein V8F06_007134 [Rhypophila decipiens]